MPFPFLLDFEQPVNQRLGLTVTFYSQSPCVMEKTMSLRSLLFASVMALALVSRAALAQDFARSAPTAAESVRVIVEPAQVNTAVPYWVLRRADQLDPRETTGRDSVVSQQPRAPGPQVPRARPGYAYGWFGVSPRSHQQHKPSVYGLELRYEWK